MKNFPPDFKEGLNNLMPGLPGKLGFMFITLVLRPRFRYFSYRGGTTCNAISGVHFFYYRFSSVPVARLEAVSKETTPTTPTIRTTSTTPTTSPTTPPTS
ncbi:MAG: hypothetical protein CVU65_14470 [Deltaproteobacteria bacterium HGW-Deltaproteobacteria-22]|nr:MAG: hypothetical protein CVU65_14470 [Deltaproteobacteria bacterium HGW-Deltaproteobacteria-22]